MNRLSGDSTGDVSADDTLKFVLCDCCGIHRVAVPISFADTAFVYCDACREDLKESGSLLMRSAS